MGSLSRRGRSLGWAGLCACMAGCSADLAPCAAGFVRDTGNVCLPGEAFAGIETLTWDGADGLVPAWGAPTVATPGPFTAVITRDGAEVGTIETGEAEASFVGLADGEYRVTVTAIGADGETVGADRSLLQLVAENRLAYRGEVRTEGGAQTLEGEGDLVVTGAAAGVVTVVDVSEVTAPAVLATGRGFGQVTDVEVNDGRFAIAQDTVLHPEETVSVAIYDLSSPGSPSRMGTIAAEADSAHTLELAGDTLYLASTLNGTVAVYDLAEPEYPVRIAAIAPPPPATVHDQTAVGSRLYSAYTTGLALYDVADPSAPALSGVYTATWEGAFVHSAWPTADGEVLAVSEEVVGGPLYVFDISTPDAIALAATVEIHPEHSIHNVVVRDTYAFCAWYVEGLRVYDLADPANPVLRGVYDTWDGNEDVETREDGSRWPNVNGVTHVWPMGTHVAVTDSARGVVTFDFFPVTRRWGDGWVE